ncbi:F-box protein At5g07610-like [Impatiens glandulifera]|uniref:F-box protein At5g07610-like n=1 Tax=Impatiens glandulifera TaxID=253017 RepID=UPI001FB0CAE6|nr:F-box protein At5g07610-like [Impatiens glandulifera]
MAMAMSAKPTMSTFVNEDLLTEIFVRLPSKSLARFKSVSKGWLSLISSPSLNILRRRRRQGLLIQSFTYYSDTRSYFPINFIPLPIMNNINNNVNDDDDYPDLSFFRKLYAIHLMTSSNGLLFCVSFYKPYQKESIDCHVINPTTRQFLTVRKPNLSHFCIVGLGLIFDPSKSIHYKLVCLWKTYIDFQVEIYSSETKSWKALLHCKSPITYDNYYQKLYPGVYWNHAIIWFREGGDCLIFDIEKEKMRTLPQPNREWGLKFCFGESGGHLYSVEWSRRSSTKAFRVYEMKEDCSGWLLTKYSGNLSDHIEEEESVFRVLSLVWTNDVDDKPYLVLDLPFHIVSFNLEDTKMIEISGVQPAYFKESNRFRKSVNVYQYVECHSSVSPL